MCNPITMRCRYLTLPRGYNSQALTDPVPDLSKPVVSLEGGKEAIEAFQRSCGKEVVVGLLTERHKQWYKLVIAGISNGITRTTLVYDSFMHQWKEGGPVPQGVRFWESGKNVNLNGYLYCITFTAGMPCGDSNLDWPWSVVRYDSSNDTWTEIRLRRRGSILPQLVEHRGGIFLVQRNGKAEDDLSFFEIKEDGTMLSLITRSLPSTLFSPTTRKRTPMIMQDWCVGQGEWLYTAGRLRGYENNGSHSPRGLTVVGHNFTRNTWVLLPTLMDEPKLCAHFSPTLNGYYSATWLHAFEPSLCAAVW